MKTGYAFAALIAFSIVSAPALAQKRCDFEDRRCSIEWVDGLKTTSEESSEAAVQTGYVQPNERPSSGEALMELFLRLADDSAQSAPQR